MRARVDDPSGIAGTVRFVHKSGNDHTISLDATTFAAVERIVAAGPRIQTRRNIPGGCPTVDTVAQVCEQAARKHLA